MNKFLKSIINIHIFQLKSGLQLNQFNKIVINCLKKRFYHKSSFNRKTIITTHSWAADKLIAQGEKLELGVNLEFPIEVTPEMIDKPSERVKEIANEYLSLDLLEINQLTTHLQKRLGLPADFLTRGRGGGSGGTGESGTSAAAEPVKVKEVFDLKLIEVDAKSKIKIIKEVRTITGLGLKEAKEMVESAPVVLKQGLKKEEAEQLQKVLVEAGAKVELL